MVLPGECSDGTLAREMGAHHRSQCAIGLALAAQLAAGSTNLILTARRRQRLETLAERLSEHHGVRIEVSPPI